LAAHEAAALCVVSAQGVAFGAYDTLSGALVDGVGNVAVDCAPAAAYTISLSPGTGSYAARIMASGPYRLGYNLFTDASRTTIWGDGTGTTATVSGSGTVVNHTVYGRIPGAQNVNVGSYSDTITVTLVF
jgi:spore coat protein U-like protein